MLYVPYRIYFYHIVLCCIKKSDWPISSFFSSVNCRLLGPGDFSSPGLVEGLALMALILPVHRTCSFYWREAEHSAQTHFYCGCIQPRLFLSSDSLNCHEDKIRYNIAATYSTCKEGRNLCSCFFITYFGRGKMKCWREERLDTSNAEQELFTAMVINSVHGLAREYLTCQHLHGAYSHERAAGKASKYSSSSTGLAPRLSLIDRWKTDLAKGRSWL